MVKIREGVFENALVQVFVPDETLGSDPAPARPPEEQADPGEGQIEADADDDDGDDAEEISDALPWTYATDFGDRKYFMMSLRASPSWDVEASERIFEWARTWAPSGCTSSNTTRRHEWLACVTSFRRRGKR